MVLDADSFLSYSYLYHLTVQCACDIFRCFICISTTVISSNLANVRRLSLEFFCTIRC